MFDIIVRYWPEILQGFLSTVQIVAVGFIIGSIAGLLIGPLRDSRFWVVRFVVGAYIEVIRNTPLLAQVTIIFAVAGVMRWRLDPELVGTVGLAIYTAAYMAEIIRGALRSIPKGQAEAAKALSLSRIDAFRFITFPQMLPFAVPASANLLATVAKESAFLSALSVAELTFTGQVIIAQTFAVFEVWAIIGFLYLGLILTLLSLAERLERTFKWASPSNNH